MFSKSSKSQQADNEQEVIATPEGLRWNGNSYVQFIIRNFSIRITELRISRSISNYLVRPGDEFRANPRDVSIDYSSSSSRLDLTGIAIIDLDTLGVLGQPEFSTNEVKVTLRRIAGVDTDGRDWRWKSQIYCFPFDWEIGNADEWSVVINVPADEFDVLYDCVDRGKFGGGTVHMDTDLWAEHMDKHRPPSSAMRWYLGPGSRRTADVGMGVVSSFHWIALPDNSQASSVESARQLMSHAQRSKDDLERAAIGSANVASVDVALQRSLRYVAGAIVLLAVVLAIRL